MLAGGCASTPEPRYYELQAMARRGTPAPPLAISVEPVTIPPDVDRPQFVLGGSNGEVAIDDGHRWAAPLQDAITLALSRNLAAGLASEEVALAGDGPPHPKYRVRVAIRAFRSRLGEDAALDADWSVRRDDGLVRSGHSSIRVPVDGPGFDALASAHGVALARLSGEIADTVLAMDDVVLRASGTP